MSEKELFKSVMRETPVRELLGRLREHHFPSYQHSARVGHHCARLGTATQLDIRERQALIRAGLLHDIGKSKTPRELLSKQGALTPEERTIMDSHPRHSYLIIQEHEGLELEGRITIAHHEYKLHAYPRSGNERRQNARGTERRAQDPLRDQLAQLIAAADIYDALASKRAYKPALPPEQIEAILQEQFTGERAYIELVMQLHPLRSRDRQ